MADSDNGLDEKEREIIDFIEEQPGRFAGTAEVAEAFDMTNNGAAYRLKELRKEGLIQSRKPSRDEVWYVPAPVQPAAGGFDDTGDGEGSEDGMTRRRVALGFPPTGLDWGAFFDVVQLVLTLFIIILLLFGGPL